MTAHSDIERLRSIMRKLRDPETGCAWDVKQDFNSIAAYTLEEAYEVVDAIERKDFIDLKDELGDLLLQVVFHAQMADEKCLFDFDDVVQSISDKMIRRHPHVFGDKVFANEAELKASWEAIKTEERKQKASRQRASSNNAEFTNTTAASALDGVAANLPALKKADKLQKRAARVGFDWPDISPVWDKLSEEIAEVHEAVEAAEKSAVEEEIGDLLFTVVNLARHMSVDSEAALRKASIKFETRFRQVEHLARSGEAGAAGQSLEGMDLEQLDFLWDKAKQTIESS